MTALVVTKDGKVKLYLATPTVEGLAKLYERLTGRSLSPERIEQLRRLMEDRGTTGR